MLNITLETSCLRSLVGSDNTPKNELDALENIIALNKRNSARIWISPKSISEISERIDEENDIKRKNAWKETLRKIDKFEELPGLFMLGFSHLGIDTYLASDTDAEFSDFLVELAHPDTNPESIARGHYFDISILIEHRSAGNDLFVTRDKHFLKKHITDSLRANWEVVICDPVEAIKIIEHKEK